MQEVSLQKLIESGAHFGHQAKRWNPKMAPYLYGVKDGVHVFDLVKTKVLLEEALEAIKKASHDGKKILIVGTKKQAREKVLEVAKESDIYYITERWMGGILTNFNQIKKSTDKLTDMKKKKSSGEYSKYTKKERLLIDREILRLERFFGGIEGISQKPDQIILLDTKKEMGAINETLAVGIETVGIVDSNSDPFSVTYPIPMNDDATKAIEYVLDLIKEAINEGKGVSVKSMSKVSKVKNVKTEKAIKEKDNNTPKLTK